MKLPTAFSSVLSRSRIVVILIVLLCAFTIYWNLAELRRTNGVIIKRETEKTFTYYCPSTIKLGEVSPSPSSVWHNLKDQILNASYYSLPTLETLNTTMRDEYKRWVDQLYSFYTPPRMRRSVMNPAPPEEMKYLLKVAREIRHHNLMENDPQRKRKLRVLVLGGSVTFGAGCYFPHGLGMPNGHFSKPSRGCAWSFHLENLLNRVLFGEEEYNSTTSMVQVDNIAAGGQSTEAGTMVLEYRLFPDPNQLPDVIISAFAANDAQEKDQSAVLYEHNQNFVKAAQGLHPCNDRAPLVIFLNEFLGNLPMRSHKESGITYMVSTWNNIMAINHASIIKYHIMAGVEPNDTYSYAPLLFSKDELHSGIGLHIGIAWTVLFNMVNSIVNLCNDGSMGYYRTPQDTVDTYDANILRSDTDINANKNIYTEIVEPTVGVYTAGDATGNPMIESSVKNQDMRSNLRSPITQVESERQVSRIDPKLLQNLQNDEPPFQLLGRFGLNEVHDIDVKNDWMENIRKRNEMCDQADGRQDEGYNVKCSYSWLMNQLAQFRKQDLQNKMSKDLLFNKGWAAEGNPVRQPREGWYTHTPNATFSIKVENTTVDTQFILIFSMKSYSPKWKNSKLAVTTTVINNRTLSTIEINRTEAVDWGGSAVRYIDGYHDIKTSVHFPHKLPIEGGAKAGDSIIVDAKLIGGQEFKIAGMALCAF